MRKPITTQTVKLIECANCHETTGVHHYYNGYPYCEPCLYGPGVIMSVGNKVETTTPTPQRYLAKAYQQISEIRQQFLDELEIFGDKIVIKPHADFEIEVKTSLGFRSITINLTRIVNAENKEKIIQQEMLNLASFLINNKIKIEGSPTTGIVKELAGELRKIGESL